MSIQWCDNFSIYGGNANLMLNGPYAQIGGCSLVPDPDGISGGYVLDVIANFSTAGARRILSTLETTVGQAARLWMTQLPPDTSHSPMIAWQDINNNIICTVGCDTTGRLFIGASNPGTVEAILDRTTNPVVGANAWWHIEAKMTINGQALTYEVRVEGATVLQGNVNVAQAGPFAQVQLGVDEFTQVEVAKWKDYVVWDGSGTQNTDFLGSVIVAQLKPLADVSLNWTPVGGATGAAILDNVPPQDGVQYIDAPNPPPAPYVASLTDLPADVTSVKCVMTLVRAAKADGGDGALQVGLISSPANVPATVEGANRPITVAQTYWSDVFEEDPKTNAPWLPSAVNAAEIQINRTL